MKKQRKHYTPETKVAILSRHLVEGVPISDLCDERGLQPTLFYCSQTLATSSANTGSIVCSMGNPFCECSFNDRIR